MAYLSLIERVGGVVGSGILGNLEDEKKTQAYRVQKANELLDAKNGDIKSQMEKYEGEKS